MSNFLTPEKVNVPRHSHGHVVKSHQDFYFSKDGFRAVVDLHDFQPEEIKVKTLGPYIIVEAIHDERSDSFSVITRKYQRKFFLPEQFDIASVTSAISPDGILFLSASPSTKATELERFVPIENAEKMKNLIQ